MVLGADVHAETVYDVPLVCQYAASAPLSLLRRLLDRYGASLDVRTPRGATPLMWATSNDERDGEVIMDLVDRSSMETRLAISADGRSALDDLAARSHAAPDAWVAVAIAQLLQSQGTFLPEHAALLEQE